MGLLDADIMGANRSEEMAEQVNAPFLGRLALDAELARRCDAGGLEAHRGANFCADALADRGSDA